jgi:hypothetical protein
VQRECSVDPDVLAPAGVVLEARQSVTLFGSAPLSGEAWHPLMEGEIALAHYRLAER